MKFLLVTCVSAAQVVSAAELAQLASWLNLAKGMPIGSGCTHTLRPPFINLFMKI